MNSNLNFPTIDHLIEGVHYRIIDWDFAQQAPASSPKPRRPGEPCGEGEKVVFGVCRKLRNPSKTKDDKDFDSGKRTKQEEDLEKASGQTVKTKEEAVAANKKGFETSGKKYGWAIKGGKPVIVEWGSVAGTKPKAAAAASARPSPATASRPIAVAPSGTPGPKSPPAPAKKG